MHVAFQRAWTKSKVVGLLGRGRRGYCGSLDCRSAVSEPVSEFDVPWDMGCRRTGNTGIAVSAKEPDCIIQSEGSIVDHGVIGGGSPEVPVSTAVSPSIVFLQC